MVDVGEIAAPRPGVPFEVLDDFEAALLIQTPPFLTALQISTDAQSASRELRYAATCPTYVSI